MKKIQIILASLAFVMAGAGVFANSMVVTTYYRAFATGGSLSADCDVELTGTFECSSGNNQCVKTITVNGTPGDYRISKIVDSGSCQIVPMP